jgi:hypothetical protein
MVFAECFLQGLEACYLGKLDDDDLHEQRHSDSGSRQSDEQVLVGLRAECLRNGLVDEGDLETIRRRIHLATLFREQRATQQQNVDAVRQEPTLQNLESDDETGSINGYALTCEEIAELAEACSIDGLDLQ